MPEQNARRRRNARGPAALLVGGLMLTSLHASGAGAPTTEWTDASWSGAQTVAGSVQAGVVPTPTNVRCVGGGVLQNPTVHWEMPSGATSPTGFRIEFYNRGLLGQRLGERVIQDPNVRSAQVNRSLLDVISNLLGGYYDVRIRALGPGGWTSEVSSPTTIRVGLVGGLVVYCA